MWPGAPHGGGGGGGGADGYGGGGDGYGGGVGAGGGGAAAAEYGNRGASAYDSLMRDSGATFIADPVVPGEYGAVPQGGYGIPAGYGYGYGQPQPQLQQPPQPHMGYAPPYASTPAAQGVGYDTGYGYDGGPAVASGYGYGPSDQGNYDEGGYGAIDDGNGAHAPAAGESDWSERLYAGQAQKQTSYAQMFRQQKQTSAAPEGQRGSAPAKAGRRASAKTRAKPKPEWRSDFTDDTGWLDADEADSLKQQRDERLAREADLQAQKKVAEQSAQAARRGPEEARARVEAERKEKLQREQADWSRGQMVYEERRTGGRGRPKGDPFGQPDEAPPQRRKPPMRREQSPPLPTQHGAGRNRTTPHSGGGNRSHNTGAPSEAELRQMKPSQLRDKCEMAGVSKADLDACLDADNPKMEYIKLLSDASRQGAAPLASVSSVRSSVSGRPMSRDESQHVARGLMRRRVPSAGRKPGQPRRNGSSGTHGAQAMGDMPMNGSVQGLGGSRRSAAISAPARVDGYGAAADMYSALDDGASLTDAHHPLQRDIASEQRQRFAPPSQYDGGGGSQRGPQYDSANRGSRTVVADPFVNKSGRGQQKRPPRRIIGDPFGPPADSSGGTGQGYGSSQQQPLRNSYDDANGHDKPIWLGAEGEAAPTRQQPLRQQQQRQQELPPQANEHRMPGNHGAYSQSGGGGGGGHMTMEEEMAKYQQNPSSFDSGPEDAYPPEEGYRSAGRHHDRNRHPERGGGSTSSRGGGAQAHGVEQLPTSGAGMVGGTSPPIEQPTEFAESSVQLCPCGICGRKFAADRLAKHESACAKASQKRKPMNIKEQRMTAEQKKAARSGQRGGGGGRAGSKRAGKGAKWKQESENFRAMLKQERRDKALLAAGVAMSDLPPPDVDPAHQLHDDRLECPSCGRFFNEQAHARHIQHCSNTKARPTRLMRGSGQPSSSKARGRR